MADVGLWWWPATTPHPTEAYPDVLKASPDTQLVILSAASQPPPRSRGVDLPANVKGEAARKAADKLIRAGLLEEVRARRLAPGLAPR